LPQPSWLIWQSGDNIHHLQHRAHLDIFAERVHEDGSDLSRPVNVAEGPPPRGPAQQGLDLRFADLGAAHLYMANLGWAQLSGADLSRANLESAGLTEAYLNRADLSGAWLSACNLREPSSRKRFFPMSI
jgi:uncharacterized protein YjbI with pentapeptide repeats